MGYVEPEEDGLLSQSQEGMGGYLISSGVKLHGEESFLANVKCFSEVSKSFFILKISPRRRWTSFALKGIVQNQTFELDFS